MLTDPDDMLNTGIEVEARPPGKKVKRLSLLSGGERSLVAVAFLVALFKARPSPFYILDEVEAALDDTNLGRLLEIYEELRENSQLLVITHQKRTMEVGDALYGVTMRGDGVSAVISQRLREAESRLGRRHVPREPPAPATDYVAWRTVTTRWRDDRRLRPPQQRDYFELFDTAVNAHLYEATGVDVRALPQIGVVAETSCRYFREIGFPEPIEIGLVVDKVGTSSIVYRIGLFQGDSDEAAAEGRFVHVYVDNSRRRHRPVVPDAGRDPCRRRAAAARLTAVTVHATHRGRAGDGWTPPRVPRWRPGPPSSGVEPMLAIILVMLLVLVAAAVVVYVAFPHRGEDLPVVPQLGDAMRKGVDALPTLGRAASDTDRA